MIGVGIGLPFYRSFGSGVDAQAQAHFNRVIADGGVVPSGLSGVNAFFSAVKAIYGTSDINTAISAAYDAHYLGYKLGAGSGTTLGQAAQKLYSVKSTENLLLQSEDFGSGNWTKLNSTITTNTTIAPNGTMTADSIVDNTTNAAHRVSQTDLIVTSGTTYTLSVYIRKGSVDYLNMAFGSSQFGTNSVFFDLTNFSVFSVSSGHSASITNEGSGWYRVTFTANCTSTGVTTIFINPTTSNNSATYIGNGSTSLILWGAQVNTGSVALPYTPTTTTTQTLADVTQTTAASQPLLLAHTGENYYFQSGVAGNFVTSPSAAANQITGTVDFDYAFIVQSNNSCSFGKINSNSGAPSYACFINGSNIVQYIDSAGSYITLATITSFLPAVGSVFYVRLTLSGTTATCFTSLDGSTWTSRGSATVAALSTSNSATLTLSSGSMVSNPQKVVRMRVFNGLRDSGGTLVADCNPASYNPSVSQTQWSSATGEVWSVSTGTATSGYKGVLVDRSIVQGDGVDDGMRTSGIITLNTANTFYCSFKGYRNDSGSGRAAFGTFNRNANILRRSDTDIGMYIGASDFLDVNTNVLLLSLSTFKRKVSNNTLQINNGTVSTNTSAAAIVSSNITFFETDFGSSRSNALITSGIVGSLEDNTTQKTAMYNYLRSINNNAF